MRHILFLTCLMKKGYGVSVVVDQLAKKMISRGAKVVVGTLEKDNFYHGYPICVVAPTSRNILSLAGKLNAPIIVLQTSPFFEMVQNLSAEFECWVWELGDPTPSLFTHDRVRREAVKKNKQHLCYPFAQGVVAISDFIRRDISWSQSHVLHLGCDHVPDLGPKHLSDFEWSQTRPLKVGGLMRLGVGETQYKGNSLLLELANRCHKLKVEFHIAGAGKEEQASELEKQGFNVHLNLSDEEKTRYLRSLDVFVSLSLWEGFNLPLVEAQALGTVGLALDIGAHPEVTPFVFQDVDEMFLQVQVFSRDKNHLYTASDCSYQFVRKRFSWGRCTDMFLNLIEENPPGRFLKACPIPWVFRDFLIRLHSGLVFYKKFCHTLSAEKLSVTVRKVFRIITGYFG